MKAPFSQSACSNEFSPAAEEVKTLTFGAASSAQSERSAGRVAPLARQASRKTSTRPCRATAAIS